MTRPAAAGTAAAPLQGPGGPQLERPGRRLARFQRAGVTREIVAVTVAGQTLVVDRETFGHGDPRLVARLEPDEPAHNAALMARLYLAVPRPCRPLDAPDPILPADPERAELPETLSDPGANTYRIASSDGELRWQQIPPDGREPVALVVTLRAVVGAVQAYQPAIAMTESALANASKGTKLLGEELARLHGSAFVLNRGLREAVLAELERGVPGSEIAMRCGHRRRNRGGGVCGDAMWLARRVGLAAEGGASAPTPWVHIDVLGLIAWKGLRRAPRDVELDWT